jgi:hypothetical protein
MVFGGELVFFSRQAQETVHNKISLSEVDYSVPPEARRKLHEVLDRWIDKSQGSGYFWVGNEDEFRMEFGSGLTIRDEEDR